MTVSSDGISCVILFWRMLCTCLQLTICNTVTLDGDTGSVGIEPTPFLLLTLCQIGFKCKTWAKPWPTWWHCAGSVSQLYYLKKMKGVNWTHSIHVDYKLDVAPYILHHAEITGECLSCSISKTWAEPRSRCWHWARLGSNAKVQYYFSDQVRMVEWPSSSIVSDK